MFFGIIDLYNHLESSYKEWLVKRKLLRLISQTGLKGEIVVSLNMTIGKSAIDYPHSSVTPVVNLYKGFKNHLNSQENKIKTVAQIDDFRNLVVEQGLNLDTCRDSRVSEDGFVYVAAPFYCHFDDDTHSVMECLAFSPDSSETELVDFSERIRDEFPVIQIIMGL